MLQTIVREILKQKKKIWRNKQPLGLVASAGVGLGTRKRRPPPLEDLSPRWTSSGKGLSSLLLVLTKLTLDEMNELWGFCFVIPFFSSPDI